MRRLAAACALAVLALVGCGGGSSAADGGVTSASTSPLPLGAEGGQTVAAAAPRPMPGAHRAPHEAVPILMYHVIGYLKPGAANPALWVSPQEFAAQVRAVRRAGFNAVTLEQVWEAWHDGGRLPRKPIVFSFDDGYQGQVRDALPTLSRYRWAGVLNLELHNLPDMGGSKAVRRMVAAGWEIDSHTITHPDLTTVGDAQLRTELVDSRTKIKRLFGDTQARFFCYPSGRYDARVIAAVRAAGYRAATTVQPGFAKPTADPFELSRVRVNRGIGADGLLRLIRSARGA